MRGVVVFVNPNVALEADDSPVPVLLGKKVKVWLRRPGRLKLLPNEVRRRLTGAPSGAAQEDQATLPL